MEYLLAAMKSRTDALSVQEKLRARGVRAVVIPTPKQVNVGCGLSVKTYVQNASDLIRATKEVRPVSFVGFYVVSERAGGYYVRPYVR